MATSSTNTDDNSSITQAGHSLEYDRSWDLKHHDVDVDTPVVLLEPTVEGPDGGIRGWSAVLGAWLTQFAMLGLVTSFGAFQSYYEDGYLSHYSSSTISWIGTIAIFLEYCLGIFVGKLLDAGWFHETIIVGSAIFGLCHVMLSLCHANQYVPILLSQGVGIGLGLGMTFLPTSGVVSQYFTKHRSLAMGITASGTCVGGFAYSAFTSVLFPKIGFAWTVRIGAFISIASLLLANLLIRLPPKPVQKAREADEKGTSVVSSTPKREPASILSLLRNPIYLLSIGSGFTVCLGLYYPQFVIETFAEKHGIAPELAHWLLSIMNLASIVGRIAPAHLADRIGILPVDIPCTVISAILVFMMNFCTTPASIVVFAILYGFFSGSIVSLYFPLVVSQDPDVTSTGLRLGLACMPVGIASLIGPPIANALVGSNEHWWYGLGYAGAAQMLSAGCLLGAYFLQRRK